MVTDEFNSESTAQPSDSDNRDPDEGTEESESLLERVRAEQREFETRINSLTDAVKEYAQVISDIRELRVQRAEKRDNRIKAWLENSSSSHREVERDDPRVEKHSSPETHHDRKRGLSR